MASQPYIAFHPIYAHPLPEGHRFPMAKYELIPEQLLYEGTITQYNIFPPQPCKYEDALLVHEPAYFSRLLHQELTPQEQRRIGFPQSPQLTERELIITQGTIDCCRIAYDLGVALNVAGGTHHAFAGRGEGFCLLNDFAVAASVLLKEGRAKKILIIDLDVHQGNGTAAIFHDNPAVFTFSMHGEKNYPFIKEKSSLDVGLKEGTTDGEYLDLLNSHLEKILENESPDFAFYLSGVDILSTDRFGKLAVSVEGCRERDRIVFEALIKRNIPCTVAMGGGYSPQVRTIVDAHCNTFRLATSLYGLH